MTYRLFVERKFVPTHHDMMGSYGAEKDVLMIQLDDVKLGLVTHEFETFRSLCECPFAFLLKGDSRWETIQEALEEGKKKQNQLIEKSNNEHAD